MFINTLKKVIKLNIQRRLPRLALAMALEGKVDQCVTFWGICCSSWIHMNSGTSKRDYFTPMGCRAFQSVEMANLLVARLVGAECFEVSFG